LPGAPAVRARNTLQTDTSVLPPTPRTAARAQCPRHRLRAQGSRAGLVGVGDHLSFQPARRPARARKAGSAPTSGLSPSRWAWLATVALSLSARRLKSESSTTCWSWPESSRRPAATTPASSPAAVDDEPWFRRRPDADGRLYTALLRASVRRHRRTFERSPARYCNSSVDCHKSCDWI
jgi:hypothetical protein